MSDTVEMKPVSEEELREALMDVVDPELGIDVVNLGLIYGIHIDEAANIATVDMTLMQSKGDPSVAEKLEDELEDAVAFAGVSRYPARIKCALLSWMAWKDATAQAVGTTQEVSG